MIYAERYYKESQKNCVKSSLYYLQKTIDDKSNFKGAHENVCTY